MIQTKEIYWLAGLLEGEGCFGSYRESDRPRIQLQIGDKDVIDRAAAIMGASNVKQRVLAAPRKPQFGFCVTGAAAAAWMMTVYALMGERRRQRIAAVLRKWCAVPKAKIGRPLKVDGVAG